MIRERATHIPRVLGSYTLSMNHDSVYNGLYLFAIFGAMQIADSFKNWPSVAAKPCRFE
jgi:hypothetical protein